MKPSYIFLINDYGLYNYESSPPYGHGYEQQIHDTGNYGYHAFDHHSPDNYHSGYHSHHLDYHDGQHHVGYFNKNYDHTLLAKTILWPLAGIALLGAAASLISNPVLLQLGVISGRRKRRDTEEVTGPDLNVDFNRLPQNLVIIKKINTERKKDNLRLYLNNFPAMKGVSMENRKQALENVASTETSVSDSSLDIPKRSSKFTREDNFIPIPLKIKPT
ncbi:unnamed protein product [Parnassius apollo]|uniref:(apollo) hypothetical protein n=1 Tax=Parnassius apollo TaxID=110799 RepID=A0A8S3X474_PARAO|nr:unnamed protein product [Parnassius apollo]